MTGTPRAARTPATVDFPLANPPVSPTTHGLSNGSNRPGWLSDNS